MVALVAVAVVAALWRPVRRGAALLAGAIIPMAAEAISAIVQLSEPISPTMFGILPAAAAQAGLTISAGLTPAFWIYCGFLVVLAVSCAWMLFTPPSAAGPRPSAGADAYAWAGPHDDLTDEEADDDDTDVDTDDVVTPDFETAPSHTEGGARFGASPAA